MYIIINFLCTK